MGVSRNKLIVVLVLNAAIAVWCAYDLWFAADSGTMLTRALNYLFLVATVIVAIGAIMQLRARK